MRQEPNTADNGRPLPVITDLAELIELLDEAPAEGGYYVRWSRGPAVDLVDDHGGSSRDTLTGVRLPGLSANPLAVEDWWGDRSRRLWAARRLYDYRHLHRDGARPWVLVGQVCGRGPDNEPLVRCRRPIAWVSEAVLAQAQALVEQQSAEGWGPLNRSGADPGPLPA
ncbi:DUF6098 family protein [Couchioplanes azureus]|uniref:DUF6098 family protein n=1 Tax=Couchioplanes caeruleus TaxID=56438 RepID=UPI00166FD780|nr:DUF6098 family protein [Couchioplanes caeruleus]